MTDYETTPKPSQCIHGTLTFGSGGYYVICKECHGRWVAISNRGNDHEPDHSRAGNLVSMQDVRTI
jgi:hypothetical protein